MKAVLADVRVTYREIDLPEECPSCKVSLAGPPPTIRTWELQDQERVGYYLADSQEFQEDILAEDAPKPGEICIKGVSYACLACNALLAEGVLEHDSSRLPLRLPREPAEDSFDPMLDRPLWADLADLGLG